MAFVLNQIFSYMATAAQSFSFLFSEKNGSLFRVLNIKTVSYFVISIVKNSTTTTQTNQ